MKTIDVFFEPQRKGQSEGRAYTENVLCVSSSFTLAFSLWFKKLAIKPAIVFVEKILYRILLFQNKFMAEINSTTASGHSKNRGVKKSKKFSTRVDLTPMVDLGFLLITFFIFTTTMSQPMAMKIFLPDDTGQLTSVPESGALTLLLGKNDMVYYYEGQFIGDAAHLNTTTFKGIRDVILNKKRSTNPKDFVVVIKPQKESVFRNTVEALDEMTINDVKHYSVVDITSEENKLLLSKN